MRYVVMIASYKRPECQTLKSLLKAGYNGEYYIVADDGDPTDYESLYPEYVLRFSKAEWYQKVDTADNFEIMTSAVYAYNFSWEWAKEHGYDCLCLFDDDVSAFLYRYLDGKSLRSKRIKNISAILDAYCQYILDAGMACGSFVGAGRLIGGARNPVAKNGFYYNPANIFIINTHIPLMRSYPFVGTFWLDSTYDFMNNMTGRLTVAFMPITMQMSPPRSMKSGGYTELYEKVGTYLAQSYGNMIVPSFFHWGVGCVGGTFWKDVPKILNEKWRKERAR